MSLPGLKSTIELEREPALRLVDRASGTTLTISETEAQVLERWDGAASATELSARVFVEGLDVEPWQVEQFFTRLKNSGLLAIAGPVVPDFVPAAPGVETAEDTVPRLRGDLIIVKSEKSRGTLEVTDPLSERTFTLYDFEVSIARMLDGKRSAAEVLSAANRLGIPVNLPTLRTFLQQLKAYKFIDDTAPAGDTTWPPRAQWTVEVRELYQGALRLLRQGKYDEALGYVDAMKEADPSNTEAATLRARIEAEAKGSMELRVDFETLHTPVSTAAVQVPASVVAEIVGPPEAQPAAADPFASFGFNSAPPAAEALPPIPAALEVPAKAHVPEEEEEEDDPVLEQPRSRKGLFIGIGLLVVVLGVLLRPVETRLELPCELQVDSLGVPRALKAGSVKPGDVKIGDLVEKGAVLAQIVGAEPERVDEGKVSEVQRQLAELGESAKGPKVVKARATLKKAQAALDAILKLKKKAPSLKAMNALEKKEKTKVAARDAAKAALEAMTHEEARATLTAELRELTAQKVAGAVKEERSVITAPASGLFVGVLTEQVTEGEAYGQIVGPEFRLVVSGVIDPHLSSAVFRAPAGTAEVKVEKGLPKLRVTAPFVGAKGTLEIAGGRTPWILTVL